MKQKILPWILVVLIFTIVIVNTLAVMFFWYYKIKWLDNVMHFLGGLWIGLSILWWHYLSGVNLPLHVFGGSKKGMVMLALGAASLASILWELFEFSLDHFVQLAKFNGLSDTLSDFSFGLFGSLIGAVLFIGFYYSSIHNNQSV